MPILIKKKVPPLSLVVNTPSTVKAQEEPYSTPPSAMTPSSAADFLELFRPGGPWVLTAIEPDGNTETITASNVDEIYGFVDQNNGKRNLHYSVNPTKYAMTSKAKKEDIARAEYVFADLDPAKGETPETAKARYLKKIESFECPPTFLIDSGNGIQGLWRLEEPIELDGPEKIADVESRTKTLTLRLGGSAGTQNIDRILRLPGTTNLPNKKKAKAGCVACPAKLIEVKDTAYPLAAFPAATAPGKSTSAQYKLVDIDVDALPISNRMKNLIRGIDDPSHPYNSRSERVMAVLVAMAAANCTDDQMASVMLAENLPIGERVREKNDPQKHLEGEIARAREEAADPDVAELNETCAVLPVGGRVVIMMERRSSEGRLELAFFRPPDFKLLLANRFVVRGNKDVPLADHWLHHRRRRQYEGLVFAPGRELSEYYNLWRGFAVQPNPLFSP